MLSLVTLSLAAGCAKVLERCLTELECLETVFDPMGAWSGVVFVMALTLEKHLQQATIPMRWLQNPC